MSGKSDQLNKQDHTRISLERIVPESGLEMAASPERPSAVVVEGEPSVGKGGAAESERLASPENHRPPEAPANAHAAQTDVPPTQEALTEPLGPPVEAAPWTPVNPHHPDHALYEQIRKEVAKLDKAHGRTYDQISERLTGSLLVLAKNKGLDRVDHVALSNPTAHWPGAHTVFVVQGDMDNPGHLRAGMPTEEAVDPF